MMCGHGTHSSSQLGTTIGPTNRTVKHFLVIVTVSLLPAPRVACDAIACCPAAEFFRYR